MSSAFGLVRFPDGDVKACVYNGTSDVMTPWLFDTVGEAFDHRRAGTRTWDEEPLGEVFDVDVYSDYGGGFSWRAHAAKNLLIDGRMPHGAEDQSGQEIYPRLPIESGTPTWVSESLLEGR